jgi:hypothetical protein
VASVLGHAEDQALSLTKNFVLPETASRLKGGACYFSATCNWPGQMAEYIMRQIRNENKNPVCFNIPSFYTVNNVSAELVVMKMSGNIKTQVTATLTILVDGNKLLPYVILRWR